LIATLLQLARFGSTGVAATLLHILVAFAAAKGPGFEPYAANACGFASAFVLSYLGHFYWTFGHREGHRRYLGRFLVLSVCGYGLSNLVIWLVVDRLGLSFLLALPWIAIVVPAFTFVSSKYWAFSDRWSLSGPSSGTLVIAAALAAAAVLYPFNQLNHDTSWYLVATRKWLDGAALYRDIMEINPPLAFYLTAPSILLSKYLDVNSTAAFCWTLLLCIAGSLFWIKSILDRQRALPENERLLLLSGFTAMMLFVPMACFGQREHLMLVLSGPYFCYGLTCAEKKRYSTIEQVAIGAVAFLGLGLKPYFLAAPALLAAVTVWQRRSFRPVVTTPNLVIGAACVAYLLAVRTVYPDYFHTVVPLARLTYGAFGFDPLSVLAKPAVLVFAGAMAAWAMLPRNDLAGRLAAISVGFLLCYFVQFKGFYYQVAPAEGYLLIFCLWTAFHGLRDPSRPVAVTGMLVVTILLCAYIGLLGLYRNPAPARFAGYTDGLQAPRVLVLSSNLSAAFPFVNQVGGEWTSRYPTQWIVPGAVRGLEDPGCGQTTETCNEYRKALNFARSTTVEDFLKGMPERVYVDVRRRKPYFGGLPFDYVAWLEGDPAFAERWKSYTRIGKISGYEVWALTPRGRG
jgi:putative flippase GtrA